MIRQLANNSWQQRLATIVLCAIALTISQVQAASDGGYCSLKCDVVATGGTWAVRDRDGANRQVTPYLSSLEWGESGTGKIVSPPFQLDCDTITFTICGHDGQGGGKQQNYIALIDSKTGDALQKTMAPGQDAMQEQRWDVAQWKGRKVYLEVHDGDDGTAFAWLGIGRIDAGRDMQIDFGQGMPTAWSISSPQLTQQTEVLTGGIPFRRLSSTYSLVPSTGKAKIECGFQAQRLFFLGCTVAQYKPLEIYGWIEIEYADAAQDRIPLVYGYTLDGEGKSLSSSPALHVHPTADPFQHYLAIQPRPAVIQSITLCANVDEHAVPRITAITCQTDNPRGPLEVLPTVALEAEELSWLDSHTVSSQQQPLVEIEQMICQAHGIPVVRFAKKQISNTPYEAAAACDVNKDGNLDIVSGAYWYEGPSFEQRHDINEVQPAGEYFCDFSDFPFDVNQDGYPDIITGDFFGQPLRWHENPRQVGRTWETHDIAQVGPVETTRFWDVDKDGIPEICPNAGGNVVFFKHRPTRSDDAPTWFTKHEVKIGGCGHGLGFGDVNGDGRGDFIIPNGWLESPTDPLHGTWVTHENEFQLGAASVPILVHDVNGDQLADLIVGQAHGYGLDWWEQKIDDAGQRSWQQHAIDRYYSQYHDIALHDIDNDDQLELITGKRYRAHNGHDPGSTDALFIRYFDVDQGRFIGHTIDVGTAETASGVGIYFWVADLNQDGRLDLVCPGKEGLFVFENLGSGDSK
jgi:hypothetical protein